jgi:hypothetical protein
MKTKECPATEETYPFDYEDLQRRAREAIEGFSSIEPSYDANGKVIVDSFEVMRQLFLSIARRMLELPPPPPGPLALGPGETEVSVRRKIRRLRMLKTEVDDPVDGARLEAEKLERRADLRRAFHDIGYDILTAVTMLGGETLLAFGGLVKEGEEKYHIVKHLPEARDPDSQLAVVVRATHRLRRSLHRRPEKRKRKERKGKRRR